MESIHAMAHPPVEASLGGAMGTSADGMARAGDAMQATANDIARGSSPDLPGSQVGSLKPKSPDLVHSMTHLTALSDSFALNAKAFSIIDDVAKTLFHTGADAQAR